MKNRKVFFCSALKYVVPADYEHWFEGLAAAGWHPVKIGQWSSIVMRFEKSEPGKYRYVVDMQPVTKKDYKQIYEGFGWEYVGQMASAHIWRRKYTGGRPEAFSDAPSREARNKRFVLAISVAFTILLLGAAALAAGAVFGNLTASDRTQFGIAAALFFVLAFLLGLAMGKVKKILNGKTVKCLEPKRRD
jgi:hypothetical protein